MKQLVATPHDATERAFPAMRDVVSEATREHEDRGLAYPGHGRHLTTARLPSGYFTFRSRVQAQIDGAHKESDAGTIHAIAPWAVY